MRPGFVKTALLSIDDRLQGWFRFKLPVYTSDENVLAGEGVYSAADWSRTRRQGSPRHGIDGHQYDSDDQYLRYINQVEGRKVAAAQLLARTLDFGRFARIFELGCGDMIQAYVIKTQHPKLRYVATDFDRYVIERCAGLPVLSAIDKRVFDVLHDPHDAFAGFDLLSSWGLDATLDDEQVVALLKSARRLRIPYLMCSPTTVGPVMRALDFTRQGARRRLLEARRIRMHGWARSVGYFQSLARAADVPVRSIGRHGIYMCLMFGGDRAS